MENFSLKAEKIERPKVGNLPLGDSSSGNINSLEAEKIIGYLLALRGTRSSN